MFSKLFFIAFVVLTLLFCGPVFAEGTKVLALPDKTQITVPELAPDFPLWDAILLAQESYPNGNGLFLVQSFSPDERTVVITLVGKQNNKIILLAFAVRYASNPNGEVDIYEDLGFLKTGHSSGHFVRVDKASPTEMFKYHLTNVKI